MTKKYICVDLDEKKLKRGSDNFPDALAINDKIENYMRKYNQEKPDLIVCVQTMGINDRFDHNQTLINIDQIFFIDKFQNDTAPWMEISNRIKTEIQNSEALKDKIENLISKNK